MKNVTEPLSRVLEHSAEVYGQKPGKDFIDLTAKAWLWKSDAWEQFAYEKRGIGQSMWLKDAIKESIRLSSTVRCIEYETGDGQTELLGWTAIREIWERMEFGRD